MSRRFLLRAALALAPVALARSLALMNVKPKTPTGAGLDLLGPRREGYRTSRELAEETARLGVRQTRDGVPARNPTFAGTVTIERGGGPALVVLGDPGLALPLFQVDHVTGDATLLGTLTMNGPTVFNDPVLVATDVAIERDSAAPFYVANAGGTVVLLVDTNSPGVQVGQAVGVPLYLGLRTSAQAPSIRSGSGTPEAAVTANSGSLYLRTDGGIGSTLYLHRGTDGTNTGWVAIG